MYIVMIADNGFDMHIYVGRPSCQEKTLLDLGQIYPRPQFQFFSTLVHNCLSSAMSCSLVERSRE